MKTSIALAVVSLCGLVSGAVGVGCVGDCTAVGCTTEVTASVAIDGGVEPLEGASAQVCREDQCVSTAFDVGLDQASCKVAGNDDFSVTCVVLADGVISFSVSLVDQDAEDEEEYSFIVSASDATVIGAASGVVTYEKTEINGDGCGYCYAGSL